MNEYIRIMGSWNPTIPREDSALLELIKNQWENFKTQKGRYPTSQEINMDRSMVTTRTIERRLGGLKKIREQLGHEILNYSSGETRSRTAEKAMAKSTEDEGRLSSFLITMFGTRPRVCSQEPYIENGERMRSDYGVYHRDGHFFVDIFCPKNRYSLLGSINHKQRKIKDLDIKDVIYYVCSNEDLTQDIIDDVVRNKKNTLPGNVYVLSFESFKNECKKYKKNTLDRV